MPSLEETIHCAEINATLYERAACFLEMKQKNQNGQLGLLLDSLTTKLVKPHPLNQSILLTQGRIQEIFMKNIDLILPYKAGGLENPFGMISRPAYPLQITT